MEVSQLHLHGSPWTFPRQRVKEVALLGRVAPPASGTVHVHQLELLPLLSVFVYLSIDQTMHPLQFVAIYILSICMHVDSMQFYFYSSPVTVSKLTNAKGLYNLTTTCSVVELISW